MDVVTTDLAEPDPVAVGSSRSYQNGDTVIVYADTHHQIRRAHGTIVELAGVESIEGNMQVHVYLVRIGDQVIRIEATKLEWRATREMPIIHGHARIVH